MPPDRTQPTNKPRQQGSQSSGSSAFTTPDLAGLSVDGFGGQGAFTHQPTVGQAPNNQPQAQSASPTEARPTTSTSNSFLTSLATGSGLSSHGPAHPPSLQRGAACLTCRQRKIKCDGGKPHCGPCWKSAQGHGDDVANLRECDYDSMEKRRKPVGGGKVHALEAKIAELQSTIDRLTAAASTSAPATQTPSPVPSLARPAQLTNLHPATATAYPNSASSTSSAYAAYPTASAQIGPVGFESSNSASDFSHVLLNAAGQPQRAEPHHQGAYQNTTYGQYQSDPSHPLSYYGGPAVSGLPLPVDFSFQPTWPSPSALIHPTNPAHLPSPALVARLVDVFFAKNHAGSGMVSERKFRQGLLYTPEHSDYPATCLLHAVLASAARLVNPEALAGEKKYWGQGKNKQESLSDYHAQRAREMLENDFCKGQKLLQVTQASVLCCLQAYTSAKFVQVFLDCARTIRLCLPLGLNHLQGGSSGSQRCPIKAIMLHPTDDPDELHERASTFWLALTLDRYCALTTGWATSLGEEQISTLLVASHGAYPVLPDQQFTAALCIHMPSFAGAHPPELCGPLQMYVKAIVLAGRVASWLQHSAISCGCPPTKLPQYLITTDAFVDLYRSLCAFINSLPRHYSHADLAQDPRLVLALTLPHAAIVLLHEGLCGWEDNDLARQRCMEGAAGVLERVYGLYSTSFDFALLSPYNCFVFAVAGRTFVRELAVKQRLGVNGGVVELSGAVEAIMGAMKACRTPLGNVSAATLTGLLANPSSCEPTHEREQPQPQQQQQQQAQYPPQAQAYAQAYPAYPAHRQPYTRDIKEERAAEYAGQQHQQQHARPGTAPAGYGEADRGVAAGAVGDAGGWGASAYDRREAGQQQQQQQTAQRQRQPPVGFGWQCGGEYDERGAVGVQQQQQQQQAFLRLN